MYGILCTGSDYVYSKCLENLINFLYFWQLITKLKISQNVQNKLERDSKLVSTI